jgi:hypothetical protein
MITASPVLARREPARANTRNSNSAYSWYPGLGGDFCTTVPSCTEVLDKPLYASFGI